MSDIKPGELLEKINTKIAYDFYREDEGYNMLTSTRYTNIETIPAAYFCSLDGKKVFKIVCEEVDVNNLPSEEVENLKEYKIALEDELENEE